MAISIFGGLGSARAIQRAADRLRPGDVILIELHRPGPRHNFQGRADQRGYIAIEWWPDDWAAIRYATRRGVLVVEAAGNGAEDLDDPIYDRRPAGFPANWTNPFRRGARDSGAIVVGAGAPPPNTHGRNHGPDRSRLDFSNYGALVDAQGWGREVTTCGYGGLQGGHENQWYTDTFSGTSSASPIVVGALGCLQGILRRAGRPALTPATARAALRATGSPQTDAPGRPRTQRIGNRPDLRRLVARVLPGAGGGGQRRAATILPLHRYWNPSGGDHFYTTNWAELGAGRAGWRYEGLQAYLFPRREAGTVPLYRYWNPRLTDHFYTTNWGELGGGRHGWRYEGIQGYVFPRRAANTTPLYRYWNPRIGDHFYTTNWRELGRGRNGWRYESVQCWVVPQALYVFPGTGTPEAEDIEPDAQEVAGATPDTFAARGGIDPALAGPEGGATLGDAADPDFPRFDLEPTNEAEAEVPAGMSDAFAHPEPGAMEDAGDSFTTTDGSGADPGPAQGGGSGHTTVHLNFR